MEKIIPSKVVCHFIAPLLRTAPSLRPKLMPLLGRDRRNDMLAIVKMFCSTNLTLFVSCGPIGLAKG